MVPSAAFALISSVKEDTKGTVFLTSNTSYVIKETYPFPQTLDIKNLTPHGLEP